MREKNNENVSSRDTNFISYPMYERTVKDIGKVVKITMKPVLRNEGKVPAEKNWCKKFIVQGLKWKSNILDCRRRDTIRTSSIPFEASRF